MTTERQNARHSTGPRTPHGKGIARCNNTCHRFHAPGVNADPPLATRSLPLSRVRERGSGGEVILPAAGQGRPPRATATAATQRLEPLADRARAAGHRIRHRLPPRLGGSSTPGLS